MYLNNNNFPSHEYSSFDFFKPNNRTSKNQLTTVLFECQRDTKVRSKLFIVECCIQCFNVTTSINRFFS